MAQRRNRADLYDVSLFESSPTDDSQFNLDAPGPSREMHRPEIHISLWEDVPEEFRPLPPPPPWHFKPLPPLPTEDEPEPSEHERSARSRRRRNRRCVLYRMRRSKSESHHDVTRPPPNFTSEPAAQPGCSGSRRAASSQLYWMDEEQMWLVKREGDEPPQPTIQQSYTFPMDQARQQQYDLTPFVEPSHYGTFSPVEPPPPYSGGGIHPNTDLPRLVQETQWQYRARRLSRPSSAGPF